MSVELAPTRKGRLAATETKEERQARIKEKVARVAKDIAETAVRLDNVLQLGRGAKALQRDKVHAPRKRKR